MLIATFDHRRLSAEPAAWAYYRRFVHRQHYQQTAKEDLNRRLNALRIRAISQPPTSAAVPCVTIKQRSVHEP